MRRTTLRLTAALELALLASVACGRVDPAVESPALEAAAPKGPSLLLAGRDGKGRWDTSGALHLAYAGEKDGAERVMYARWNGSEPVAPVAVSPPHLKVSAHGEVPPALEVLGDGTVVVAYPVALPGKWKGEIRVQVSSDGGRSWSEPALLHDDGEQGSSHSFLASVLTAEQEALFAWLDNRGGAQGLRTATTSDGRAWTPNRTVDPVTCQCCATEIERDQAGRLWLAYRDLESDGRRDISLVWSDDGGRSFTEPAPLAVDGWQVEACPHTGPRLDQGADGDLWAVWLTGADPPGIYVARRAGDGAGAFGPRQRLVAAEAGHQVLHPEVAVLPGERVVVVYEQVELENSGSRRTLRARVLGAGAGEWGPPVTLVEGGSYPRVEVSGQGVAALLYTRQGDEGSELVVADLPRLLERAVEGG